LSDIGTDRPHQETNGLHVNGAGVSAPDRHDAGVRELDRSPWADDHRNDPPWPTDAQWFTATGEEVGTETDLEAVEPADARRPRHGRRDERVAADDDDGVTADTETQAGADGEEADAESGDDQGAAAADGVLETSTALAVIAGGGDLDDSAGTPRLGLPVGAEARPAGSDETGLLPAQTTALRIERIRGAGSGEQEHRQREDAAPTGALALDEPKEAPQARGYPCARGHLNDPKAQVCAFCGVRMEEPTGAPTSGPRPPLGLLVFDDGATYTVDTEYLVGRMPEADARVTSGALRGLALDDPSGAVSRVHVEVLVNGGDALLVDAGSRNGTYVLKPGDQGWTQLAAGEAHRLVPGTRIRIGGRSFTFESLAGQR
jgi:FHA domain